MTNPRQDVADIQVLAHIIQLAHRRERCLAKAAELEHRLTELRGNCSPRLRRTIDRLTLIDTTRLDRPDQHAAGRSFSDN